MTDKKVERLLNSEADAIIDDNREKILGRCGVRVKERKAGGIILKTLAVAASVAFIAAFAYVCYLPIYMQEHGLTPGMQPSDTVDTSKITAQIVGTETDPKPDETEPEQTGEKLTLDAVHQIIASSKTYAEICERIAEVGEFAGIYGSGIVRTMYKLYSDETVIGYLTVSDLELRYTIGPNSYALCEYIDYVPGHERDMNPPNGNEYDYGEYNGYRVKLVLSHLSSINDIEVGGYSFRTGSSDEIKAEKDGVSYSLKAAYKKGFLTEDDIAKINMIHRRKYGLYYDSPEEFEKAVRYNAGLTEIMNNNTDQNEINRLQLSLFKSIYGSAGKDPAEEITLPDYSEYKGKFAPDSLLICIVKKSDGSEYTVQDFPELELTAVDKLMDYKDGTCSLGLYLKNPGDDNVLEAIRLMLERSDVKYAEPNWIQTIDD